MNWKTITVLLCIGAAIYYVIEAMSISSSGSGSSSVTGETPFAKLINGGNGSLSDLLQASAIDLNSFFTVNDANATSILDGSQP